MPELHNVKKKFESFSPNKTRNSGGGGILQHLQLSGRLQKLEDHSQKLLSPIKRNVTIKKKDIEQEEDSFNISGIKNITPSNIELKVQKLKQG